MVLENLIMLWEEAGTDVTYVLDKILFNENVTAPNSDGHTSKIRPNSSHSPIPTELVWNQRGTTIGVVVLITLALVMTLLLSLCCSNFMCRRRWYNCYDPLRCNGRASWIHRALWLLQGVLVIAILLLGGMVTLVFFMCGGDETVVCDRLCNDIDASIHLLKLWVGLSCVIGFTASVACIAAAGSISMAEDVDRRLCRLHTASGCSVVQTIDISETREATINDDSEEELSMNGHK